MLKKRILGMLLLGAMLMLAVSIPVMANEKQTVEKSIKNGVEKAIELIPHEGAVTPSNGKGTTYPNIKIGGGDWQVGTFWYNGVEYAYSNYYHPTDDHSSYVTVGSDTFSSPYTAAGQTSYATSGPLYGRTPYAGYFTYE